MSEIVEPMVTMKMSLEEFVALKAFVSWKRISVRVFVFDRIIKAMCEISDGNKYAMRTMLDDLCTSLHQYYEQSHQNDLSERFGNIILLLSSVFAAGLQFVESHHEVAFFDLWQLESLLVQLRNVKVIEILGADPACFLRVATLIISH
uniref:NR LBD domain-containing protein n=1 Tax=Elaeophora elaphi TaxID=1147741 RepID=A0A0R3S0M1_9BILA